MRSNTAFKMNVVHFMGRNMSWHFRAQELYRSTFLNASDGLWRFKVWNFAHPTWKLRSEAPPALSLAPVGRIMLLVTCSTQKFNWRTLNVTGSFVFFFNFERPASFQTIFYCFLPPWWMWLWKHSIRCDRLISITKATRKSPGRGLQPHLVINPADVPYPQTTDRLSSSTWFLLGWCTGRVLSLAQTTECRRSRETGCREWRMHLKG